MQADDLMSIGEVVERTGVAHSALRFYEDEGLIHSERASSGHRRYRRDVIRRVSFVRVAQLVGLSLADIRAALDGLPHSRTPTQKDWEQMARSWAPVLDERIAVLERLRDQLTGCFGCGCLSMTACALVNPGDEAAEAGPGPRYVLESDEPGSR